MTNMKNRRRISPIQLAGAVLTFALALPPVAGAQNAGSVDAAAGYSWMSDYEGDVTFPRGWFASVGADVPGPIDVVGAASGSYKTMGGLDIKLSMSIHTLMGGPRVMWRAGRLAPHAQVLVGLSRITTRYTLPGETLSASQNHVVIGPGGGLDVTISDRAAIRVGTSLRVIRAEMSTPSGSEPVNYRELQILAGIVVR